MDTSSPSPTRRERREAVRAAHASSGRQLRTRSLWRRIALWGGIVLVLAGIVWLMVRASSNLPTTSGNDLTVPVSAVDHVFGSANAPVTLVEYADFQCPACALFNDIIKEVIADPQLTGKLRLVYRYFPLTGIHQNAQLSAQAAEAAALQGKFWEMHDALFATQAQWENLPASAAQALFTSSARQLGLDVVRWTSDLSSSAVNSRIQADVRSGTAAGVDGTPTFFVNGVRMPQPGSYNEFRQDLINALAPSVSPTPHASP